MPPVPDPATAWEVYEKAGLAGLFLFMYLTTVGYLIYSLVIQQREAKETTKMVVKALEESTAMNERCATAMEKLNSSVDAQSKMLNEFVAYLKGRDSRSGGERFGGHR